MEGEGRRLRVGVRVGVRVMASSSATDGAPGSSRWRYACMCARCVHACMHQGPHRRRAGLLEIDGRAALIDDLGQRQGEGEGEG